MTELQELLDDGDVQLIDVREAAERDGGYIPGSKNIPFRLLRKLGRARWSARSPSSRSASRAPRATIAASLLQREGFDVSAVAEGGVATYDGEVVSFRRCGGRRSAR